MIAPQLGLPLVEWNGRRNIPLSEGWLTESIQTAAVKAGYSDCAWSCDVARAISFYLETEFPGSLITTGQLHEILDKSLRGIGLDDVAEVTTIVAPRVSIYLPELACQSSCELFFFHELREKLQEALRVVVRGVRLEGLRPCVKMLEGTQRWQMRCESLSDEIVLFTRDHLFRDDQPPVELVIS